MSAIKLDGELLAAEVREALKQRILKLERHGVRPGLGTILVGNDGPSENYVAMKHRDCKELGMHSNEIKLPETATQEATSLSCCFGFLANHNGRGMSVQVW